MDAFDMVALADLGDDDDNELLREYLFDIVQRSGEVENILEELARGPYVKTLWKTPMAVSRNLTPEEVDKLVDPDVVDWHDFHMEYAATICKHRATNKQTAPEKSNAQLSAAFDAQDKLKDALPGFVDGNQKKEREWKSAVVVLAGQYQTLFDLNVRNGGGIDLPTRVREILAKPWEPEDQEHKETIYYICGAVMRIIENLSERSKDIYVGALKEIKANAASTKADAKSAQLPSAKVEAKEVHSLCYANSEFFRFVCKIESVFHILLSEGNVAYYGASIIRDISLVLSGEDLGIGAFLTKEYDNDVVLEVLRRIVRSYGRLRGKDFVRKCNARAGIIHHETLRATLGVGAAGGAAAGAVLEGAKKAKRKSKGKGKKGGARKSSSSSEKSSNNDDVPEEEKNPRWQFLMKQQKKFLVDGCKARNLPHSGMKKVLTRRIIEREQKEAAQRKKEREEAEAVEAANPTPKLPRVFDEEYDEYLQGLLEDFESHETESMAYFQQIYETV